MKESGESTAHLHPSSRRRRRCLIYGGGCLLLLIVLGVIVLVLYLTLLKPRDPTTKIVSARVTGVFPRVTLPAVRIELNVTLDLDVLVHNPNRAAFDNAQGHAVLLYRGGEVGDADVAPGRIPAHGDAHVQLMLRVEADRLVAKLGKLVADALAGEVAFDSSTRIPGRITLLGFFKHHAVAQSSCHVVIGVPNLKLKSQECSQKTKL